MSEEDTSPEEEENFSDFGKSFQEKLAAIILLDRSFADRIEEVIEFSYFEYDYLRLYVREIYEYKLEYDTHPSLDTVGTIIKTDMDNITDETQKQIQTFHERISQGGKDIEDADFVKEEALKFCRTQKVKSTFVESVPLIKECKFDQIEQNLKEALRKGSERDFGLKYKEEVELRYQGNQRSPISTGWDQIDSVTGGGHGAGELGVIIAPSGAGKSFSLVHLGAQAVSEGHTAAYFTLELAPETIGQRFDSWHTDIPLDDLHENQDKVQERVSEVPGNLFIKKYPPNSATTNTIRKYLERLKQNETPADIMLVDYADLLSSARQHGNLREELKSIYEDLRAIADEFKIPCWTVSQTNRQGVNKDVITKEEISEAYNKCFVSDLIFGLSRTAEDKNKNQGRLFVAKNRNGPDGQLYPMYFNPAEVDIRVMPPNKQDKTLSPQDQLGDLKEAYENVVG